MLYIATKAMQFIIEGFSYEKSGHNYFKKSRYNRTTKQVNDKMNRGITVYSRHGYYLKEEKKILYIVISSQEVVHLKRIMQRADEDAFIAIHDVKDVFGKGFIRIDS